MREALNSAVISVKATETDVPLMATRRNDRLATMKMM
jgi:hypothetical protein